MVNVPRIHGGCCGSLPSASCFGAVLMHCRIFGLLSENWVLQKNLTAALGSSSLLQAHKYITSDPSVSITGTLLPVTAKPSSSPTRSLQEISSAAFAATEELTETDSLQTKKSKTREVFIRLALHQGWNDQCTLARFMGISYFTVRSLVQTQKNKDYAAAALCLGDERLRRF